MPKWPADCSLQPVTAVIPHPIRQPEDIERHSHQCLSSTVTKQTPPPPARCYLASPLFSRCSAAPCQYLAVPCNKLSLGIIFFDSSIVHYTWYLATCNTVLHERRQGYCYWQLSSHQPVTVARESSLRVQDRAQAPPGVQQPVWDVVAPAALSAMDFGADKAFPTGPCCPS
jgi:hypothetical protein